LIHFTIPLPPVSKKNSQQILKNRYTGKSFISPSQNFKDYQEAALWYIPNNVYIDFPVGIKCLFYMPTLKDCDLTNLLEAVDDILVKAGLLSDDKYSIVNNHDGSRVLYDKENPRTEIYIEVVEDMYKALKAIEKSKEKISKQQYKTLRGQCLAGDVAGALKGLENLLRKKENRRKAK